MEHIDGPFVIGGSFPAMKLLDVIACVVDAAEDRDDGDIPPSFFDLNLPALKANDIDVYHDTFGDGSLVITSSEGTIACVDILTELRMKSTQSSASLLKKTAVSQISRKDCTAKICLMEIAASLFTHLPTLALHLVRKRLPPSDTAGQVVFTNHAFSDCHTKLVLAPQADALCRFVWSNSTLRQLKNFFCFS